MLNHCWVKTRDLSFQENHYQTMYEEGPNFVSNRVVVLDRNINYLCTIRVHFRNSTSRDISEVQSNEVPPPLISSRHENVLGGYCRMTSVVFSLISSPCFRSIPITEHRGCSALYARSNLQRVELFHWADCAAWYIFFKEINTPLLPGTTLIVIYSQFMNVCENQNMYNGNSWRCAII